MQRLLFVEAKEMPTNQRAIKQLPHELTHNEDHLMTSISSKTFSCSSDDDQKGFALPTLENVNFFLFEKSTNVSAFHPLLCT